MNNKKLFLTVRILFGIVFVISGLFKITDLASFIISVKKFNLTPDFMLHPIAYSMPVIEIILGLAVVFKFRLKITLRTLLYILIFFTVLITAKLLEGERINCGCFGSLSDAKISWLMVLRNIGLLISNIILVGYYSIPGEIVKSGIKEIVAELKKVIFILIRHTTAIIFVVLLLVMSYENRILKDRLITLMADQDVLKKDEYISSFVIKDFDKDSTFVDFTRQDQNSLIVFLSSHCYACKNNAHAWKDMLSHIGKRNNIYFIALNDEDHAKEYFRTYPFFGNKAFYNNSADFRLKYKGYVTPQTMIVDKQGKILKNFVGMLSEDKITEIIDFF